MIFPIINYIAVRKQKNSSVHSNPSTNLSMRYSLSFVFLLASTFCSYAQTSVVVPAKAVAQLERLVRQTQAEVVIGSRRSTLPPETRPMLNKLLVQTASEFLALAGRKPSREDFYKSLDTGLARIKPLVTQVQERQQVAEYFQDMLDIVGLESSEGRLTAFVESPGARP
ncbi:DUF4844 domain-containing protein [Hymenobacter sp. UYCo722]|uniref:DUF4844 domain-containing protein n=1 Tax=Hymenobacter sp. UYCo722 TaxID=3156335 RepID=UPI003398DBE0